MKTKLITLFFFSLLSSSVLFATIRRVGYTDVPAVTNVDYTTFYAAHQAAVNGDTIYVFPGKVLLDGWAPAGCCSDIVITKRLTIVSVGNWLDSTSTPKGNSNLQVKKQSAYLGRNLDFGIGSKGSVITGFDGQGQGIGIYTDSITIKRNFNIRIYFGGNNCTNLSIEGNYRAWFDGNDDVSNEYKNITIKNNFIYRLQLPLKSYSGIIANNTFAFDNTNNAVNGGDISLSDAIIGCCTTSDMQLREGTWLFQNNLIISNTNSDSSKNFNYFKIFGGSNSTFNYNVALQSNNFTIWPGIGIGNVFLPPSQVANIFEGFPAIGTRSADDRYILKANSPANVANRPGSTVEAGMFGGTTPYKLSTIPSIPTIYKISSPQGNNPTGGTIEIKVSTRSNN